MNSSWEPLPGPQSMAFTSEADILFYGGAAGGGKTELLLGAAHRQQRRSILFRREYVRRWPDNDNPDLMRYTPTLTEVSLVDNPAVPTATFQLIKSDGSIESRSFTLIKEKSVMSNIATVETPEDDRISELLDALDWLEQVTEEEANKDILLHINALQDYLASTVDEDDDIEEGDAEEPEDDDDTTAQAYATELARVARRVNIKNTSNPAKKTLIDNQLRNFQRHIDALQKRVLQLEAQPLPAKGALRIVNKSDGLAEPTAYVGQNTSANHVKELMKIALSRPVEL